MWPFGRAERRADATVQVVEDAVSQALGTGADAGELALAEAAAGLWERAIAGATVAPMSMALTPVSPPCLALAGRALATRGNAVFVIEVGEGVRLLPCSSWDVRGEADPATWRYRLDLIGPSGTMTVDRPSASVLHFRVGADAINPWRGRAPLRRSPLTAKLAGKLERHLTTGASVPAGLLIQLFGTPEQIKEWGPKLKRGGASIYPAGGATMSAADLVPRSRIEPANYGAKPSETAVTLRSEVGREVLSAFGVPPTLFAETGDGAGQREAWRRFWLSTIAPVGGVIEAELRAKLDPQASVEFPALRASDEDGRSRAASRRAAAFKTFRDAGIGRREALRLAGLDGAA